MSKTTIEWAERVWNPVRGCSRVSAGCDNCYAMRQAHRFSGPGGPYEGLTRIGKNDADWSGVVRLVPEMLDAPLRWRTPARVFVNSMSDLFHESLSFRDIAEVFDVMASATAGCGKRHEHEEECWAGEPHTYLVLTKRPHRAREFFEHGLDEATWEWPGDRALSVMRYADAWPLPNVWLGVSVEDQATAEERIPELFRTPAAVRWVSYEPALAPVDFNRWTRAPRWPHTAGCPHTRRIDWIVVGGESGPRARPCGVSWVRSVVGQCRAARVPVFVKQFGRWILGDDAGFDVNHWLLGDEHGRPVAGYVPPLLPSRNHGRPENAIGFSLFDRKGGDMSEWPEDLRIREFPTMRSAA